MYNYAYIENGKVTAVLVFDDHELPKMFGNAVLVTEETGPAGYNYLWDGERFTVPEPEIIDVEEVTPTPALEG
jgi:hypothetical protein